MDEIKNIVLVKGDDFMQKTKILLPIACVIILFLCMVTGCGIGDKVTGKWIAANTVNLEDYDRYLDYGVRELNISRNGDKYELKLGEIALPRYFTVAWHKSRGFVMGEKNIFVQWKECISDKVIPGQCVDDTFVFDSYDNMKIRYNSDTDTIIVSSDNGEQIYKRYSEKYFKMK